MELSLEESAGTAIDEGVSKGPLCGGAESQLGPANAGAESSNFSCSCAAHKAVLYSFIAALFFSFPISSHCSGQIPASLNEPRYLGRLLPGRTSPWPRTSSIRPGASPCEEDNPALPSRGGSGGGDQLRYGSCSRSTTTGCMYSLSVSTPTHSVLY